MPLDSSSYALALLRLDGRRWNELRRLHAQISTQAAADGSSYFEMGITKVLCTVAGPVEGRRGVGGSGGGGGGSGSGGGNNDAEVRVEISIAGFSSTDRKKRGRGDKLSCLPILISNSSSYMSYQVLQENSGDAKYGSQCLRI